jgi:hypothetical protein
MARRLLAVLLLLAASCGGRPFAEGSSRELTIVSTLPSDAPELLLLRAIVERIAIRIDDETAYVVRLASPDDAGAYRARNVILVGHGGRDAVPKAFRRMHALWKEQAGKVAPGGAGPAKGASGGAGPAGASGPGPAAPFLFTPDVWLRGQTAGIVWTEARDAWIPEVTAAQNRLFQALDRATFAGVRERLRALPQDGAAEEDIAEALGVAMTVPRGMRLILDRDRRAALLLEEGPPARLLRLRVRSGAPPESARAARDGLARLFRPDERTLDLSEPLLSPDVMVGATRQLHGRWEDAVVSAAGPFRYYELARGALRIQVDLAVFAPGRPKLPYLRELHAIAETIAPARGG